MATTQYIGARYVPKFYENSDMTAEWRSGVSYEPLTIVTYNGNSYTSKRPVPAEIGNPSENPIYWAQTGIYNEQVEEYRAEVEALAEDVAEYAQISTRNVKSRTSSVAQIGVYDTGLNPENATLQGSWCDGNIWYEYVFQGGISGRLYSFNMATGRYVNDIEMSLYHGNDFVKCGAYVYGAPYDDGMGSGVNDILRFVPGGTVETISVFNPTGYDCLYGIDKIDDDTLICALRPYGNNNVDATVFYLYHITAGTIEAIPVNWNNLVQGQNSFPHPMVYRDGKLYLTASGENGFYVLEYKNGALDCISYNAIPLTTAAGLMIAELEGVGFVDRYGSSYLVFTATTAPMEVSILFCAVNLTGNSPAFMIRDRIPALEQNRIVLSYDDPALIYETGADYPVKRLWRACAMANYNYGGDVEGNVVLPAAINEPTSEIHVIYTCAFIVPSGGCTISNIVRFIRANCYFVGGGVTFSRDISIQSFSKVTFGSGNHTFNAMRIADSECNECQPNKHLGLVNLQGANYKMSIQADQTPNVNAIFSNIIQVNKNSADGIQAGGGTTVLLAGVK